MSPLPESTVASVCDRLGVGSVSTDLDGLTGFYRAWCLNVPFDNLRKTTALLREPEGPLPSIDADPFFAAWLQHGVGGTCWPHGEALYTILTALGFDARRATGSMYDALDPNHATTLVHFADGSTWLVDNALHTMAPLRIDRGALTLLDEPVHFAEVECEDGQVFVHGTHPPMPKIFFRLRERDVPKAEYEDRWLKSRGIGPFNERVHIRRNESDRALTLRGGLLFMLDVDGLRTETLDGDGIRHHLTETMRVAPPFVEKWAASGGLEISLTPPATPPDLPVRIAPSKR